MLAEILMLNVLFAQKIFVLVFSEVLLNWLP
jgi:hypothetical protein